MSPTSKSDKTSTKARPQQDASDTGTQRADEDHTEHNLDEALEETFPASDPIAVEPEKEGGGKGGKG